jgi:hypothetical protein
MDLNSFKFIPIVRDFKNNSLKSVAKVLHRDNFLMKQINSTSQLFFHYLIRIIWLHFVILAIWDDGKNNHVHKDIKSHKILSWSQLMSKDAWINETYSWSMRHCHEFENGIGNKFAFNLVQMESSIFKLIECSPYIILHLNSWTEKTVFILNKRNPTSMSLVTWMVSSN